METETAVMFLQVKEHPGLPVTTRRQKRYGIDSPQDAPKGTSPADTLVPRDKREYMCAVLAPSLGKFDTANFQETNAQKRREGVSLTPSMKLKK